MATITNSLFNQKTFLFDLLKIQQEMEKSHKGMDVDFSALRDSILRTKVGMTAEDVAWVEQIIAERV